MLLKITVRYHRLSKWIDILTIIYVLFPFLFRDLLPNVMTTAAFTMITLYVEVSKH